MYDNRFLLCYVKIYIFFFYVTPNNFQNWLILFIFFQVMKVLFGMYFVSCWIDRNWLYSPFSDLSGRVGISIIFQSKSFGELGMPSVLLIRLDRENICMKHKCDLSFILIVIFLLRADKRTADSHWVDRKWIVFTVFRLIWN